LRTVCGLLPQSLTLQGTAAPRFHPELAVAESGRLRTPGYQKPSLRREDQRRHKKRSFLRIIVLQCREERIYLVLDLLRDCRPYFVVHDTFQERIRYLGHSQADGVCTAKAGEV